MLILLQFWKQILLAAILAALIAAGLYVKHLHSEIDALKTQTIQLKLELTISEASIKTLQTSLNEQNAAVEKLKADADARVAASAAKVAKANADAMYYKKLADDLMHRQPPQGVSNCDAANALFNEEILKNGK